MTVPNEKRGGGFKDIRGYVGALEDAGMLRRVAAEVDLEHEIGAITVRALERGGPAILFENVKDYPGLPLAANLLTTDERVAFALGVPADHETIYNKILTGMENRMGSVTRPSGPCKEEVFKGEQVDLYRFP